jgi:hypothetical protein
MVSPGMLRSGDLIHWSAGWTDELPVSATWLCCSLMGTESYYTPICIKRLGVNDWSLPTICFYSWWKYNSTVVFSSHMFYYRVSLKSVQLKIWKQVWCNNVASIWSWIFHYCFCL